MFSSIGLWILCTIPLDTLLSELITLVSAAEIRPLAGAQ